jgi:MazG family protein
MENNLNNESSVEAFRRLLGIMDELREKCPWDRKQTIETLRPQTIEETYELSEAVLNGDMHNISKELGDVLLHIVFYAKIGKEQGLFEMKDVINNLCNKLIYRHPHVFGDASAKDAEQVVKNWEQLKTKEKDGNKTVLSGVPESMPAMIKAYRMQDKARAVGFDWAEKEQVWEKVEEEIGEFKAELKGLSEACGAGSVTEEEYKERAQGELGDLFFSLINAARLYNLNPDTALESTCKKFRRRFTYLENETIKKGRNLSEMTLPEMDKIWEEAKRMEEKR